MSSNIPPQNIKQNPKTASRSRSRCCERHMGLKDRYLNLHFIHRVQDPAHGAVPSTDKHSGWVIGKKRTKLQGFDGGSFRYVKNLEMKEKEKLFLSNTVLRLWGCRPSRWVRIRLKSSPGYDVLNSMPDSWCSLQSIPTPTLLTASEPHSVAQEAEAQGS